MIKKLTKQMLLAQVLSVLTTSICMLVDSLVIGRCLGVGAVAAYGLSSPILLIIGGIGTILSAGVQASCSKSIGKGQIDEANKGYSSAVGTAVGLSLFFLLFVVVLQNFIPTWMGAGKSGDLFESTRGYLIGFTIGAPACMVALVMIPFLQMAGQMALLISAVVAMTVTDIALDLVNAYVLHWGLFGMGLASALSYYVALLVAIWYFFSSKSIFKFRFQNVSLSKVAELFKSAIPSVFNIGTGVVLVFLINTIRLRINGSAAVAAYSVMTTLGNASNCISTGVYGVSLTLTGILYQEEVLPELLLTDTQIGMVAQSYYKDENFGKTDDRMISLWKVYNLFTGSNKSSYIDNFLDRAENASVLTTGLARALHGDPQYSWFLS